MLSLHYKNQSFTNFFQPQTGKYYLFALIMGACWYGSLLFYSKASQLIGGLGPVVGWPLFMVMIILTSSFWGWRHKEWSDVSCKVRKTLWTGLICLLLSVAILALASYIHG
jgi:L-rhamnose-H+ transport protein